MQSEMMSLLSVNILKLLIIFLVCYVGGLFVKYNKIRVNYTRKINHFFLFFMPSLIDKFFIYNDSTFAGINEILFGVGSLMIFIKPIRTRVSFIGTAFSSFDRAEDRPYTLLWVLIQEFTGYLVFMPAINIYEKYRMVGLLSITVLISVFGDGLAEPVGVCFGKHRYLTYAIFSKKKYLRTIEGSMMVFITSVVVTFFFHPFFSQPQYIVAVTTIPISMTLAEALSPHTIDNPLMSLIGFTNVFLIKQFI